MLQRRRSTVRDVRRDNRSVLLSSLYFDRSCCRHDLCRATGLSPASVSNVVRELIGEGVVAEAGSANSEGGRPRVLLQINADYGYVIGVDVGYSRVRVELFDLMMTERAKADYPVDPRQHGVDVIVEAILTGLDAVIANAGVSSSAILGIGVGVPGIVEHGPEVLVHGQTVGWESVPLERLLRAGTGLPLHIDNGARTMGQAELWFGAACRCGARGCLEAYVGAEAILDRYGHALPGDDQESALAALIDMAGRSSTAAEVMTETARYIGIGIADMINLINPERIILSGWAGLLLGERMLPAIREAARQHSLRHPFAEASIELGRLGPDAVGLGAATLPIEAFLNGTSHSARHRARSAPDRESTRPLDRAAPPGLNSTP